MLANFLNKSKPINFIGLLIFFVISFLITVFETDKVLENFFLLLFFIVIFFFFNFVVTKNNLTFDNSIAYYVFTLLIICFLSDLLVLKSLVALLIYILFLRKIYSLRTPVKIIQKLFDNSFWLGVLFILEPFSIFLFIVVYSGILLHQKITIQTIFTPILGFIAPIFIYFTYFFWVDKTEEFTTLITLNFDFKFYKESKVIWVTTCVLIVAIFCALIKSIKIISVSNTFRKSWALILINFIVTIFMILSMPNKNGSEFIFVLFPVSVIIANGIEQIQKKWIKNLILYSFLFGCIFFRFFL